MRHSSFRLFLSLDEVGPLAAPRDESVHLGLRILIRDVQLHMIVQTLAA